MVMDFKTYQIEAGRTCADLGSAAKNILHMEYGLLTEIGELTDIFKKKLAYGKEIDRVNLLEEVGDTLWYLANLARMFEIELPAEYKYSESDVIEFKTIAEDDLIVYIHTWLADVIDIAASTVANQDDPEYFKELKKSIIDFVPASFMFFTECCLKYGITIQEAMQKNIDKLKTRYPDKFTTEAALNRDLVAERNTLEGNEEVSN